ncbi:hypothetical protein LPB86_09155 [Pedobacter sp. MC2016-14]|uniref:hypothetical protein n=1 Tax=Pedobacter sp. MC2016-14 TaxID=2897327 RepID=UPI001E2FD796|nr:hypothetical protein [Pedobacter sp. MC2016-14]MCD0488397.1 hypothetical protein [Pedobacter sp. MC2016-14]
MKIDKELLEKYHAQQCTAEEAEAVETWLYASDSEEMLQLPISESKVAHKMEMWQEITTVLPPVAKQNNYKAFFTGAIAASLVLTMLATVIYQSVSSAGPDQELVEINNTSLEKILHLNSNGYTIAVGTNTSGKIDNNTGIVDLSGSILISPKKDIQLSFEGTSKKFLFKKGQTYILLKGKDGKDKILIVDTKNLMDLPPVLQKQIINEFDI